MLKIIIFLSAINAFTIADLGNSQKVEHDYETTSFDYVSKEKENLKHIIDRNLHYDKTNNINDLPTYDFVVAGAGSGGCALVYKLLKVNPLFKILLIEGGTYPNRPEIFDYRKVTETKKIPEFNIDQDTVPQPGMRNLTKFVSNGKGMGGSSLHNDMIWVRGAPQDYDEWAYVADDPTWKYENLLPLFKEIETYAEGGSNRGSSGPMYTSSAFNKNSFSSKILDIYSSLGYKKTEDHNTDLYGISFTQMNTKPTGKNNGIREDSYEFLVKKFIDNPNLNILTETIVDRFVMNSDNEVQYLIVQNSQGESLKVRAQLEHILSAGALSTPLILMRSGVGRCDDLMKFGIECKLNLPGVGQNFHDHFAVPLAWSFDPNNIPEVDDCLLTGYFGEAKSSVDGDVKPKYQVVTYYKKGDTGLGDNTFGPHLVLEHPKSRGSIELQSRDPNVLGLINPNYLGEKQDLDDVLVGVKALVEMGEALQQNGIIGSPLYFPQNATDSDLIDVIMKIGRTSWHYCSSTKMGSSSDPNAVVNSKLQVFKTKKLRIADASIMPFVPTGNTNYPTIAVGLKCGEILLQQYNRND